MSDQGNATSILSTMNYTINISVNYNILDLIFFIKVDGTQEFPQRRSKFNYTHSVLDGKKLHRF